MNEMEQFGFIWDAREDGLGCHYSGPYGDMKDAEKAAERLNKFVHQQSSLGWINATVVGPFYTRSWDKIPLHIQRELHRIYNS